MYVYRRTLRSHKLKKVSRCIQVCRMLLGSRVVFTHTHLMRYWRHFQHFYKKVTVTFTSRMIETQNYSWVSLLCRCTRRRSGGRAASPVKSLSDSSQWLTVLLFALVEEVVGGCTSSLSLRVVHSQSITLTYNVTQAPLSLSIQWQVSYKWVICKWKWSYDSPRRRSSSDSDPVGGSAAASSLTSVSSLI